MILAFKRFEAARTHDEITRLLTWLTDNTCDGIETITHKYPKYFVFANSSFEDKLLEIGKVVGNEQLHELNVDLFSVTNGHGWTLYQVAWRHRVEGGFLLYHDYYLDYDTDSLVVQLKLSGFQIQ
jgi:hypothetical protein